MRGTSDSLDEVMEHGFSHGFGASTANRELVRWLRDRNRDRPAEDKVRFFGFDAPTEMTGADSPRLALTALHRYLAAHLDPGLLPCTAEAIDDLVGDDERWTNPTAAMDPSKSVGSSPQVRDLRLVADDLLTLLVSESPRLLSVASSPDEWWEASLCGRAAAGLLRYHAAMADTSAGRVARLLGLRDTMMADNLCAILRQEARRGPTIAFAHNLHLQKGRSQWRLADQVLQWWCAGAIVAAHLGDRYTFLASAVGSAPHRGIDGPRQGTLEGLLSTLPEDRYLIVTGRLAAALARARTELEQRTDTSTDHSYFPLEPGRLDQADGVVFIKEIGAGPG